VVLSSITFYMFAVIMVIFSLMVIFSRNPVHSVLFLIGAFLNASGIFVLLGAEFLAMILIIVYVGAVAVLFMFVVMMLNVNVSERKLGLLHYLPSAGLLVAVLLGELIFAIFASQDVTEALNIRSSSELSLVTNTEVLGSLLYTRYFYLFQGAGVVLLIAMIGAIVLTLRQRDGVRRQVIANQVQRRREESIEIKSVKSKTGIKS